MPNAMLHRSTGRMARPMGKKPPKITRRRLPSSMNVGVGSCLGWRVCVREGDRDGP